MRAPRSCADSDAVRIGCSPTSSSSFGDGRLADRDRAGILAPEQEHQQHRAGCVSADSARRSAATRIARASDA